MCRIAGLFLLQRLKGRRLGDTRDFNNMQTRAVIKFFCFSPARQGPEGNSRHSDRNIRGACTIVYHRKKLGDFSNCDAPRPGRPKTVTPPEIIDPIHEIILEDLQILAKSIAKQLGISRERVRSFINEDLDIRKLSVKLIPKCLNADQKRQRC